MYNALMNAKRIAELARGLTRFRGRVIYAMLAYAALSLALFSCSQPPAQQQPTSLPPTPAIAAATAVPVAPMPPTNSRSTPASSPIAPTSPPIAPTPTAVPDYVPLPDDAQFTQITSAKHHGCGLQADETVLCWGRNVNGSLEIPDGYRTLSQISVGLNFSCGLRDDGAIACWGDNGAGQASPPDGSFDEVAAGRSHVCALDDGVLICWGAGFPDGAETIQEIPSLSAIQAGAGFTCGLTPDADMACLSKGDREIAITPGPFTDIGIGLHHVCAIRDDGSVLCVLINGNDYLQKTQPPPTKFVQLSGGWHHTCGITETSDIECWGSGVPGTPGLRLDAPGGKFTAVSIGWRHSCALNPDGHATCWQQKGIDHIARSQHHERLSRPNELSKTFDEISFDWPTELFHLPNGDIAIVELEGFIAAYSVEPSGAHPKTILDLVHKTVHFTSGDGMFSAALDPQFEEFPFLYVYYRVVSRHAYGENMPGLASRLARFRIEDGQAVRDSELTILELDMPSNHRYRYGGAIRFGADRMLYLSIGDNKLPGKAQSLDSLHGKIIRIDVRGATPEQPFRVPPDNPFVNHPEARPEIWAYGLRNPWRMDFAPDGRLFIADVGAERQEEVSLAAAGANLGWPLCEGNFCEEGESDAAGLTAPIFTYGREDGCSIIGGVTAPQLNNGFLFGDHCSKQVWLLEQDEQDVWNARIMSQAEGQILSFGMDADGTVYVLTRRNPIMRLQIGVEE